MKRHIISMILVVGGMAVAMFSACQHSKNDSTGKNEKPAIAQTVTESILPEIPGNIVDARHPDVKIHVGRGQTLAMQTEGLFLTAVDACKTTREKKRG
jgi:flagellar basal body-associated protein FliL